MSENFAVSFRSTPAASHIDERTVFVRHVSITKYNRLNGFWDFLNWMTPTSISMTGPFLSIFADRKIDFSKCRGQLRDNAVYMAGEINGVQQKSLEKLQCPILLSHWSWLYKSSFSAGCRWTFSIVYRYVAAVLCWLFLLVSTEVDTAK